MNKKLCYLVAIISLSSFAQAASACKYYAYVAYGPAMLDGYLDKKQNAYRSSGLRKNQKGFRAIYTSYGQTTLANGFAIENIGPFDSEAVAYSALTSFLDDLKQAGYVKKSNRHTFPAVIIRNKKPCD